MHKTLALVLPLAVLGACNGHAGTGREPDEYVGCATDENWATFDDVTELVADADAPKLTSPAPQPDLPSQPVAFTWNVSPTVTGTPAGDVGMDCTQWNTGFSTLHLAPISGTVYDLQVSVGGTVVHRVLTTMQKWQASPAVWATLSGKSIAVRVRRIVVLKNDRKDGPFAPSSSSSFKVQ